MKDLIKNTILLTVTCLVASGLLAAVYQKTKPIIEENKIRKEVGALQKMVSGVETWVGISELDSEILRAEVKGEGEFETTKSGKEKETIDDVEAWIGKGPDGKEICRVVKSGERGYGSTIKVLVAVGSDGTCTAVTVIEQNETPGLGVKVTTEEFLSQFKKKKLEEIRLDKDGGKIDALTGATISSGATVKAVRKAMQPPEKK